MNYYLAVDGGGTKTQVLLSNDQGEILGEGWSGPTSLTATTVGAASFNLKEAVRQAVENQPENTEITSLVMGLAGMDSPGEETKAQEVFTAVLSEYSIHSFKLVNDIVIALESGTDAANACALISGTGSNCWGRNEHGLEAKTGGMDFLLTDQGSGYAIGRQVLREAVKSFDGRRSSSLLEKLVCEHFHISSIADIKEHVYNPLLTKTEVGELAKLCSQAYDAGDERAAEIFNHASKGLVEMVETVILKLEMKDKAVDCVLVGSITKLPVVYEFLETHLKQFCPEISLLRPEQPPVYGALKLAMRR